jgi:hypothetical protein
VVGWVVGGEGGDSATSLPASSLSHVSVDRVVLKAQGIWFRTRYLETGTQGRVL